MDARSPFPQHGSGAVVQTAAYGSAAYVAAEVYEGRPGSNESWRTLVRRIGVDGETQWEAIVPGAVTSFVALPNGVAVGTKVYSRSGRSIAVTVFNVHGAVAWSKSWERGGQIRQLVRSPSGELLLVGDDAPL